MFRRCVEIEPNPACSHNIGHMIENGWYSDRDARLPKIVVGPGFTPTLRAVQYYNLAARYGQQESIDALMRLGYPAPSPDLIATVPQALPPQAQTEETGAGALALAYMIGCTLAGGDSATCLPGAAAQLGQPQPQPQPQKDWSRGQVENPITTSGYQPVSIPLERPPLADVQGSACTHNTNCTWPATCMKPPGASSGTCAVEVNQFGVETHRRTGQGVACRFDADCGTGFTCSKPATPTQQGICVKR